MIVLTEFRNKLEKNYTSNEVILQKNPKVLNTLGTNLEIKLTSTTHFLNLIDNV